MNTEVAWMPGKHQWSAWNRCTLCGLQRSMGLTLDQYVYEVGGEFDLVPAPCIPRLEDPVDGLMTTRAACDQLGITHAVFINHSTRIGMHPTATLVRGNVYLWRFSQIARIEEHLKANGRWPRGAEPRGTERFQ